MSSTVKMDPSHLIDLFFESTQDAFLRAKESFSLWSNRRWLIFIIGFVAFAIDIPLIFPLEHLQIPRLSMGNLFLIFFEILVFLLFLMAYKYLAARMKFSILSAISEKSSDPLQNFNSFPRASLNLWGSNILFSFLILFLVLPPILFFTYISYISVTPSPHRLSVICAFIIAILPTLLYTWISLFLVPILLKYKDRISMFEANQYMCKSAASFGWKNILLLALAFYLLIFCIYLIFSIPLSLFAVLLQFTLSLFSSVTVAYPFLFLILCVCTVIFSILFCVVLYYETIFYTLFYNSLILAIWSNFFPQYDLVSISNK